jgi:ribosomal protein S27E
MGKKNKDAEIDIEIGLIISTQYYKNCNKCGKQLLKIVDIKNDETMSKPKRFVYVQCNNCKNVFRIEYKHLKSFLLRQLKDNKRNSKIKYYDNDLTQSDALWHRVKGSFESGKK